MLTLIKDWVHGRGFSVLVGICLLLVSWIHFSPESTVLNYFDPLKMCVWAGLCVLLAVVWVVSDAQKIDRCIGLALGLAGWMVIRTFWRPDWMTELGVLWGWLLPLLLFMLGYALRLRPRQLAWGLLCVASIQMVVMLLQRGGFDPFFAETTGLMSYLPGRMIGTMGYHNQALDFVCLCSVGALILTRRNSVRLAVFLSVMLLAGLTANRGGMLALTMAAILSQWANTRFGESRPRVVYIRLCLAFVVILAVASMVLALPGTRERMNGVLIHGREDPAVGSRMVMSQIGLKMWQERPLTGWGAGEYAYQYLTRLAGLFPEDKTHAQLRSIVFAREAHNDYIQFAAEFGVIGLILFILLVGVVFRQIWMTKSQVQDMFPAFAYVAGYMAVASLVAFPWQTSGSGPLAGLLLGILTGAIKEHSPESKTILPLSPVLGIAAKTMVFLLSLVLATWYFGDAYFSAYCSEMFSKAASVSKGESVRPTDVLPPFAHRYEALLGAAYAKGGSYGVAEPLLLHAVTGYKDPTLYSNLGNVYARQGKWIPAGKIYQEWANTGINHEEALKNLSIAYENMGQFQKAREMCERRAKLWPDCDFADIQRLAVLEIRTGDAKAALNNVVRFEDALRRRGHTGQAELDNLAGAALLKMGRYSDAEIRFKAALMKKPSLESARRNLEQCQVLRR